MEHGPTTRSRRGSSPKMMLWIVCRLFRMKSDCSLLRGMLPIRSAGEGNTRLRATLMSDVWCTEAGVSESAFTLSREESSKNERRDDWDNGVLYWRPVGKGKSGSLDFCGLVSRPVERANHPAQRKGGPPTPKRTAIAFLVTPKSPAKQGKVKLSNTCLLNYDPPVNSFFQKFPASRRRI